MSDEMLAPPGSGYRELDARLRPLEIQVNRMDAALSDIPRRQTHLENEISQLRGQQGEILTLLREMKARLDANDARDDNPLNALAEAMHRQMDEREKAPANTIDLARWSEPAWQIAKILAFVLVIVLGGKQALTVLQ